VQWTASRRSTGWLALWRVLQWDRDRDRVSCVHGVLPTIRLCIYFVLHVHSSASSMALSVSTITRMIMDNI